MEVMLMTASEMFIRNSIEINLFFQRIMKEHLFFIQISLHPVQSTLIMKANDLKQRFESLLARTVKHAQGLVPENMIKSGEIVTTNTLIAEQVNSKLTGVSINTAITKAEYELIHDPQKTIDYRLEGIIVDLNERTKELLMQVIDYQKELLKLASQCKIFINLYSEMLVHITSEAEFYLEVLKALIEKRALRKTLCESLDFWNHIMGDHANFVDGLLDPTEKSLKELANDFAAAFERLVDHCNKNNSNEILQRSIETTGEIREFKTTATLGILNCEIKAIIPPLLADHLSREANFYFKMLTMIKKKVN